MICLRMGLISKKEKKKQEKKKRYFAKRDRSMVKPGEIRKSGIDLEHWLQRLKQQYNNDIDKSITGSISHDLIEFSYNYPFQCLNIHMP